MSMRPLSKSKLMAYRQCAKRLWLEVHRPGLREDPAATRASFRAGHQVGALAQQLYDVEGEGTTIDLRLGNISKALAQTQDALETPGPIFGAGFAIDGALSFADVMLRTSKSDAAAWRMVEVKSSTEIKDYYLEDASIQAFIAKRAGVALESIALAHINRNWVYPGDGDYRGLLVEHDVSGHVFRREDEVQTWINAAQAVVRQPDEPAVRISRPRHAVCVRLPLAHCERAEPCADHPVQWLPRVQGKALKGWIDAHPRGDLNDVPDDLLTDMQRRVKAHTLSGETFFDAQGAAADLAGHSLPAYFIDFETIQFAVPIWKGTRPFQQIPFQFSVHRLSADGQLEHRSFVDLSGDDPSLAFTRALVSACGDTGPVFVYNASFEATRIRELAGRFGHLESALLAINARIVDLLRITERRYYHPGQKGSWSIKSVLPAIAPELNYGALDGVQDGAMAMDAFREAIAPETSSQRRTQIEKQLTAYCGLDTYAMVRLWQFLAGRRDIAL
ncbi:hypothetical protein WQE_23518 [Paraburkholderia hospita]|uniref:DUF2779 domain-containing protein n=1 Tax=Paraburkholderia hospita TaxID=169430 RepID=A0ABN0FIJ3_9BURK|nr:DUF2779 domain-containing protein [Paraburkholderia hospita]EIM98550.1 hypothetical protein WQE_23518 [Paraburkholderia hospita]OUL86625.1 hypothetical protein CA602_15445 [Paraburkholderia hospita]